MYIIIETLVPYYNLTHTPAQREKQQTRYIFIQVVVLLLASPPNSESTPPPPLPPPTIRY